MAASHRISFKVTAEQREMVAQTTRKNAEALELAVEELEERIAPLGPVQDPP